MATRIVFLGAKRTPKPVSTCPAFEMHADDASALVAAEVARVELSLRGGELFDALTLTFTDSYLAHLRNGPPIPGNDVYAWAFECVRRLLGPRVIDVFEVPSPIPFTRELS